MSFVTDLAATYDDTGETAYWSSSDGDTLQNLSGAALAVLGTEVLVIVEHGNVDGMEGADDPDVMATLFIQAQGDYGLAAVHHGDEFSISGEIWKVRSSKKSIDALEWIVVIDRLSRDV